MRAFIVRPFGVKQNVDFDRVDKELIQPALQAVGITGSTTAAIVEQGNIREDMFAQLLLADLVVADVSIHNANVFYELGIRHSLRDRRTFLIRCSKDEIPFDLKTDRYLSYPEENPALALEALTNGLKATMLADKADSPVFFMLPKLEAQDPERFLAVPQEFGEEVERAKSAKQVGKLALLAYEAAGFAWEIPALRSIAEALYQSNDLESAGFYWEKITESDPNDQEANDRLATIYQRRAEEQMLINREAAWDLLTNSDLAIERVLNNGKAVSTSQHAELLTLKGRNAKVKWIDTWCNKPESDWKREALKSTYLIDAYQGYERGFQHDLNHYYSGLNALALVTIIISLAEANPDVWENEFETAKEAADELFNYKERQQSLAVMVKASLAAQRKRLADNDDSDDWLDMSDADLACLTSKKPTRVANLYGKVLQKNRSLTFDSARRQLNIYKQLGVLPENVTASLAAFPQPLNVEKKAKKHYVLFTGHMIDQPDRTDARFPPSKEAAVRTAIYNAVAKEKEKYPDLQGIAGGANGGDIIFQEICVELNIPSELYLAIPREQFVASSVAPGGSGWIERFDELYDKLPKRVLSKTKELPRWLQKNQQPGYIWERNNLWMLNSALVCGGAQMTLIALWNGKGGDGPGGTQHMVEEARKRGSKTVILDINAIN